MEIVSIQEAKASNLRFYFTGKPCKRGHLAPRYTSSRQCRECHKGTYHHNREWYHAHKDDPGRRERSYARVAEWRRQNPEKARAVEDAWRKAHPERDAIHKRTHNANRRSRQRANGGKASSAEIAVLFDHQKGKCAHCGKRARKMEVDHIKPLLLGGTCDIGNLQLLCRGCNRSKGATDPIEWAQKHVRLL
jgi:5-methylcytosine-specific restriction endonuclease McrA